ncbi:hypothetical protein BGZ80_002513 [Entomortierella chlamydospora]|uniref:Uncharacterized protein n=1 Tax=Entomortierella chlamydospora TaxID=101097 RepID=A0A9P6SX27_9FUNG|nr:hypothetical protein BGZ79_001839 [Entomortierella chlamydospora]KAG0009318.1 hypothetical protein BGZ80_002513 [Entomortierella chlamydospora]
MMTTNALNIPNRALEELSEQIVAITKELERLREIYNIKRLAKLEEQQIPNLPKSSSWNSVTISSSKVNRQDDGGLSPLTPGQHPIVLATWATSTSDSGYQHALARQLLELISEKRKHSRELELARARSDEPRA